MFYKDLNNFAAGDPFLFLDIPSGSIKLILTFSYVSFLPLSQGGFLRPPFF